MKNILITIEENLFKFKLYKWIRVIVESSLKYAKKSFKYNLANPDNYQLCSAKRYQP